MFEQKEIYPPSQEFLSKASIKSPEWLEMRQEAADNLEAFWEKEAKKFLWRKPWNRVLEWNPPFAKWFVGGELNISENCLDRHLGTPRENKTAILWEGEPGEVRQITYRELHEEVCRFANGLKKIGIRKGDRVAIYMPLLPEVAVAMLACARIGATHNVVFGGFSAESLRGRLIDSRAKALITADGGFRRGKVVPLKLNADTAIYNHTNGSEKVVVEHVIVLRRTGENVSMQKGRDLWWHDLVAGASTTCPPESLPSDHPLYILYTSGTTGKPKGVVHGTGGYLVGTAATAKWIFDLKDEDIYWCTADVGWVTGHSYVVYGPLANGSTLLMYEGAPNWPHPDRFWDIIERHKVTLFYTAPTAVRACIQWGDEWPRKHNLSSLRLLGTVGEPINPEVWRWYHHTIGGGRCPIVDTWWQTETGMILISPFPGAVQTKPGSATFPLPGIDADVVDEKGNKLPPGQSGYLILRKPWPAMLMTIYGDGDRYKRDYWSRIPGVYFTGDEASIDQEGYFWIKGRIDDVLNVAGHRLGTAEVESALVTHPSVAEAAAVGIEHPLKGQAVVAFVTLKEGVAQTEALVSDIGKGVDREIGKFAHPEKITVVKGLPKTRSGKIMRRLLRRMASGETELGDVTTLEDPGSLKQIAQAE